ncbi:hypothetical protein BDV12DRAFT_193924 [Aspergillus spectabilis]
MSHAYIHVTQTPLIPLALSSTYHPPHPLILNEWEREQYAEREYEATHKLLLELFPPWWPTPPIEFYRHIALVRHQVHVQCRRRGMTWQEEVYWYFKQVRPLVRGLMPWEESLMDEGGWWGGGSEVFEEQRPDLVQAMWWAGEQAQREAEMQAQRQAQVQAQMNTMMHAQMQIRAHLMQATVHVQEVNAGGPEYRGYLHGVDDNENEDEGQTDSEDDDERYDETDPEAERQARGNWTPGGAKRRQVEGDCMICLCPLEDDMDHYSLPSDEAECELRHYQLDYDEEGLVWCKAFCGISYHADCFDQWTAEFGKMRKEEKRFGTVTCPSCRRRWRYY